MLLTYAWLLEDIHSLFYNHHLKCERKLNIGAYFVTADFVNFYQTFRSFFVFFLEYAYRSWETKQGLICREKPRFIIIWLHACISWRKRRRIPLCVRTMTTYILYSYSFSLYHPPQLLQYRARVCRRLRSPGIDSFQPIQTGGPVCQIRLSYRPLGIDFCAPY